MITAIDIDFHVMTMTTSTLSNDRKCMQKSMFKWPWDDVIAHELGATIPGKSRPNEITF